MAERGGGRIIVDTLVRLGIRQGFCVPGESFLEILDAAVGRDDFSLTACRHEGGAAFMAEAWGKLTGTPGLCIVTRGPGACNAAIGIHTARQDSTPLILLVGQVARGHLDREAFQEVDMTAFFTPLAKWSARIDQADRIPEYLSRAYATAMSGRPGPVVLALPEDMLRDVATVADLQGPPPIPATMPDPDAMARMAALLAQAERPLAIVGGSGWSDDASLALARFAVAARLPIACSFRRQDIIDNASPAYVGDLGTGPNPTLAAAVAKADLILAIGTRLGEIATGGYTRPPAPDAGVPLVHIHADIGELGRVYRPDVGIVASPDGFARALSALSLPSPPAARAEWAARLRQDYGAWQVPGPAAGALDLGQCFQALRNRLPGDAIITNDAGNFSGWGHRFLRFGRPGRQLGPTSGAMGYGVPAAVAAKIAHPDRLVIGMVGDGGFLMTGQELATAVQAGVAPILMVFDNGMYGTIRMHQEMRFPGRVSATDLRNPDFAAMARSFGALGLTVRSTDDFMPALDQAIASGKAAVIHLIMDAEDITTRTTLTALRKAATG